MKLISTKIHGVLDYLTAGALFALPRLLGWNRSTTNLLTGAALGTVGYSLLTDYEMGLVPVIPMRGHLALDAIQSAALGAAPFFNINAKKSTGAALLALSLFEAFITLNSETRRPFIDL